MRARFDGLSGNRYLIDPRSNDSASCEGFIQSRTGRTGQIDSTRHLGYLPCPIMNTSTGAETERSDPSLRLDDARASVALGIVCPMANEEDSAERFVREVLSHCA